MRQSQIAVLSGFAILALGLLSSASALAVDGPPKILLLAGNKVSELTAEGTAAGSKLEDTGGKTLTSTGTTVKGEGFETSEGSTTDTNLWRFITTLTGVKKEKVACRSENAKGEKDPIETVLMILDAHIADETTIGGVLEPTEILRVLGAASEAEVTIVCGVIKTKVKGRLACLMLPGLTNIPVGAIVEVLCKLKAGAPGQQETGTCVETKLLCEELAKDPLEANLGEGFKAAAMEKHIRTVFNKDIFIDD